jgi:hypothetical protein
VKRIILDLHPDKFLKLSKLFRSYPNPNWSTPTIPLNANVTLNILIDGNAFTFQRGFYYTITINTSRANYGFTVTA